MTGWESKALGDVCEILDSRRRPVTKKDRRAGEFPYYGATGVVDYVDEFIFDEPLVLVGEDGAKWGSGEGTAFPVTGRYWVNNHAHVLRPNRARLLDAWLVYYLVHEDLSPFVSGLTVPKLNQGSLREIPILLPPVEVQRRIVAILDEAFEGIATVRANAEKNLQNARELFDGQLQSTFSMLDSRWPRQKFHTLATDTLIGLTRSAREQGDDLRCRYVKMNNISADNRFDSTQLVSVDATDAEVQKFRLRPGDFLFNTRNSHELVGKSCIFESADEGEVVFNNNIMRVRFRAGIDCQFVLFAFSYGRTREQLEAMKSGTTNVAALYYRDLATLDVPTPDATTQRSVSKGLSTMRTECDRLAQLQQRRLTALDQIKKSLLHQAFAGALTDKSVDKHVAEVA